MKKDWKAIDVKNVIVMVSEQIVYTMRRRVGGLPPAYVIGSVTSALRYALTV
jgi:hypothetical protein